MDGPELLLIAFVGAWVLFFLSSSLRPSWYFNSFFLLGCIFMTLGAIAIVLYQIAAPLGLIFVGMIVLLIFLVPAILIYNGILMLKREGRSLANLLSMAVGIGIGVGEIATLAILITNGDHELTKLFLITSLSVIYFSIIFLAFMFYSLYILHIPRRHRFDFIIIHGSGLINGNTVPPLFASRIDKAIQVYNRSRKRAILIPSGGQGSNETMPEGEAMHDYLIAKGIPEDHIIIENQSTTTYENLLYSKTIIEDRNPKAKVALVTSNYHVYRVLSYARDLRMKCAGIGAKVAWYYWPSALIREFIAIYSKPNKLIKLLAGWLAIVAIILTAN